MQIQRSITIQAPSEAIWDLLANRFHEVGTWASIINESGALPSQNQHTGIADRMCNTPDGVFKEQMTAFDEEQRTFSYLAYEGLPGFVREGGNTWRVRDIGRGKTEVSMHMKFDLNPVAEALMGWMMKRQMTKAGEAVLDDLKIYAESGQISQRKREALARFAKKRAA